MDVQSKRAVGGLPLHVLDARQDGLARVSAAVMDADGTEPDENKFLLPIFRFNVPSDASPSP